MEQVLARQPEQQDINGPCKIQKTHKNLSQLEKFKKSFFELNNRYPNDLEIKKNMKIINKLEDSISDSDTDEEVGNTSEIDYNQNIKINVVQESPSGSIDNFPSDSNNSEGEVFIQNNEENTLIHNESEIESIIIDDSSISNNTFV